MSTQTIIIMSTLPGAWCYRVSTGTVRPSVSILWLGEVESWICNFYLSVAARKLVWADPSLRYTSMLPGRQETNKQQQLCFSASRCSLFPVFLNNRHIHPQFLLHSKGKIPSIGGSEERRTHEAASFRTASPTNWAILALRVVRFSLWRCTD